MSSNSNSDQQGSDVEEFVLACNEAGVSGSFRDTWVDRYFDARHGILPPPPWFYSPLGKLKWTPSLKPPDNQTLRDDEREEILLILQYEAGHTRNSA